MTDHNKRPATIIKEIAVADLVKSSRKIVTLSIECRKCGSKHSATAYGTGLKNFAKRAYDLGWRSGPVCPGCAKGTSS